MKHEPSARPDDARDDPVEALDVIVELASLPAGTLLTVRGMAQIFGKSPNTIMRAVGEGRLPRPFRIFSENCWRAGDVDVFLQRRMQDAQRLADEPSGDARSDSAPDRKKSLDRGRSPIRLEPHAGNT